MCTRLAVALAACGLLGACGFSPVYATRSAQEAQIPATLSRIAIRNISDRDGQALRNLLMDRLYRQGRPDSPLWVLEVAPLVERLSEIDITKDSDATRGQLRLETRFVLRDAASGEELLHRTVRATTGYNIVDSRFATRVTEDAARRGALEDIARQIESALALFAARR